MDQPEGKKTAAELHCETSYSSDSGNASNAESQSPNLNSRENPTETLNYDVNPYETSEELDFEDEKREEDYCSSTSQTSAGRKFPSEEQDEKLGRTNSVEMITESSINVSNVKTVETNVENSRTDEQGVDLEEGEADDGNVDMEDGEIESETRSDITQKFACRFYQRGKCSWGENCNYLHLSDKGLYNMLDSSVMSMYAASKTVFVNMGNLFRPPPRETCKPPTRQFESSFWDRALVEAKERIKQSRVRKEEGFEEKLYMTGECDDRFIDEWEYSHVPVVSSPKRQVCDFSSRRDHNKPVKPKNSSETVEPKLVRRTYGSKTEWRDPWRRSTTPPHRKRCLSKPSSDSSQSSWTSRSCRSPCPKRPRRRISPTHSSSKRSQSHLYKCCQHRQSPVRSPTSCSCTGSVSSCSSDSSSADWSSKRVCSSRKKRGIASRSPVHRKKKESLTPEKVVLPYKRRSRSVSRGSKVFQKNKSFGGGYPRGNPKNTRCSRSRSLSSCFSKSPTKLKPSVTKSRQIKSFIRDRGFSKNDAYSSGSRSLSNSSKSSTKLEPPVAGSSDRSCRDISISPDSDGPVKRSDKGFLHDICLRDPRIWKRHADVRHQRSSDVNNSLRSDTGVFPSGRADKCIAGNSAPVVAKVQPKVSKRIRSLEMELLKYGGGGHASKRPPVRPSPQSKPRYAESSKRAIPIRTLESASNNSKVDIGNKLTRRDMLMVQLKAVEEAIAKRKRFHVVCD